MKKAIVLLQDGSRKLTTIQTAQKHKYKIIYLLEVELVLSGDKTVHPDKNCSPVIGNYVGSYGRVYKIVSVEPVIERCIACNEPATHTLLGQPYCSKCYYPLVRTAPIVHTKRKIHRNEKCPCGSGKKYKNCHMKKELTPQHYYNGIF